MFLYRSFKVSPVRCDDQITLLGCDFNEVPIRRVLIHPQRLVCDYSVQGKKLSQMVDGLVNLEFKACHNISSVPTLVEQNELVTCFGEDCALDGAVK
jgi:hypothetical protein